ncbi:MAG: hypothetical protein P1Q69_10970 [Candidatus Thorarchaeota archaeon]|nr:hypothetical protein [Candidatus Thorarchaeota archaeon]
MFVFKKEQEVYDFGGVTIGGSPGENPAVLVGGLFFTGQPIVENTKEGTFNEALTKEWISVGNTMMEKTGHPLIIQVYGRSPQAMEKHISFVAENFDGPIMFESTNMNARIRGIELCDELGLSNRFIYNSINLSTKAEELEKLKTSSLDSAVVLGWSPRATSLLDRMSTIKQMIESAKEIGIEKMLVDPATMPVGAGFGLDYRTLLAIKSDLGLPTCIGSHNAPSAWKFLKQPEFDDESAHLSAVVSATIAAQLFAADCIMFGSMIRTREVFIAVALMANAIATSVAESHRSLGISKDIFEPPTFE